MAAGDSWDSRLVAGLAEHLAAQGLGVWRPDGPAYVAGEVAITVRDILPEPAGLIAIALYPGTNTPDLLSDYEQPVQLRLRGTTDPRVCDDLASEIFDLLEASGEQTWGSGDAEVSIVDVTRTSYTSLGQDSGGRWERSENYLISAMRPNIYRSE